MKKIATTLSTAKWIITTFCLVCCMTMIRQSAIAQIAGTPITTCQFAGPDVNFAYFTTAATGSGVWTNVSSNPTVLNIQNPSSEFTPISGVAVPGVYHFALTNGTTHDTLTVTILPAPVAPVLTAVGPCLGNDSIVLHNNPAHDTIQWYRTGWFNFATTSAADSVTVPTSTYNYNALVVGPNGCRSMFSDTVIIVACNGAAGPDQTLCQYGPLSLFPAMPQFRMAATGTGTWSALSTNPSTLSFTSITSPTTLISGTILPGVYAFVWTTSNGPDTMNVTVKPAPDRPILVATNACIAHDSLVAHNNTAGATIEWWWSSTVIAASSVSDSFFLPPYPDWYTISEVGINGCTSVFSDTVYIFDTIPSVSLRAPVYVCGNTINRFLATPVNAGNNPTYQWYLNGTPVGTDSAIYSSSSLNTNDSLKVVLTTSLTCAYPSTASAAINIVVSLTPQPPTLSLVGTDCLGTDTLIMSAVTNSYELNWYNGSVLVDTTPFPVFTVAGTGILGAAANQLDGPDAVVVDRNGNIYVADGNNSRIQKFPAGSVSGTPGVTVAGGNGLGSAANQLAGPAGIFVDTSGNLYVADDRNNRIQKFPAGSTSATNGITVAGGNGQGTAPNQLYFPSAVYVDKTGNIYVADQGNFSIQKFPPNSNQSTNSVTVAGGNGMGSAANQLHEPTAVTMDNSGNLYVMDESNERVQKFPPGSNSATNGITVAGGNGNGTALNQITFGEGLALDANNNIYVSDYAYTRVLKFPAGGNSSSMGVNIAGGIVSGSAESQFNAQLGICLDNIGNLYVADAGNNRIQKWVPTDSVYIPLNTGAYTVTCKTLDGCTSLMSNIEAVVKCSSFDTLTICRGSADTLNPYLAPGSYSTFIWTPGTGLSDPHSLNPVASPLVTTTYILSTADTGAGGLIHDTVLVMVDTLCHGFVWPGDADNNGIVDNTDLLPIGLTYNFNGPARAQEDMLWYAHYATPWADTIAGGINDVYSDCNGDGSVNITDVNAILNNYSLTHAKAGDLSENRSGNPVLKLVITPDTLLNGDGLVCRVILGDSNNVIASNVYGIAFTLNYNPLVVDSSNIQMTFPDCWLATQNQHITLAKNDYDAGAIYAGLSRIDRTSRNGAGEIALVNMVITTDNIDGKDLSYYTAQFSISNVKMIDQFGDTIPVNRLGDSAVIGFLPTGITANEVDAFSIKLFPDPADNSAQVSSVGGRMSNIILTDVLGRQVATYNSINASNFVLPTSNLFSGLYFAQITIGNNTMVKKFLVQH